MSNLIAAPSQQLLPPADSVLSQWPARFINWQFGELRSNGKLAKLPRDPRNLKRRDVDGTDIHQCVTFPEAHSIASRWTGFGVGVVLDGDGRFCLDIDACRDPATGKWDPRAEAAFARLSGAAWEVSQSGRGLHIFGRADPALLAGLKPRWNGYELYSDKRFIALGRDGLKGDPDADRTAALRTWWSGPLPPVVGVLPPAVAAPAAAGVLPPVLAALPVVGILPPAVGVLPPVVAAPAAGGPLPPDLTIMGRLVNAPASPLTLAGVAPTNADLWNAAETLARFFPPDGSGEPFDHSRADHALLCQLHYWTGGDAVAMERVFGQSPLGRRDKWQARPDYRKRSVEAAITVCAGRAVHRWGSPTTVIPAATPVRSGWLSIAEQAAYFAGCVYVRQLHRVLTPTGEFLRPEQFRAQYGGREFTMDATNAKTSRNAFEVFTESRAVNFPKVARTTFRPDLPTGAIVGDAVNIWRGWAVQPDPTASCELILSHMHDIVFGETCDWALDWLADIVQHPTEKPGTAIIVCGVEGSGKDTIADYFRKILGNDYYASVDNVRHLISNFNAHMQDALLINVTDSTWGGDRTVANKLKAMVTQERHLIERKGVDAEMRDNFTRFFFSTNEDWAISASKESRRWLVVETSNARVDDIAYFKAIRHERDNGGAAALLHLLLNRQISHNLRKPPATDALAEQRRLTLRGAEGWLAASIEAGELLGWGEGWPAAAVTGAALRHACETWLADSRHRGDMPTPKKFHLVIAPFCQDGGFVSRDHRTGKSARYFNLRSLDEGRIIFDRSLGKSPKPPTLALVKGANV